MDQHLLEILNDIISDEYIGYYIDHNRFQDVYNYIADQGEDKYHLNGSTIANLISLFSKLCYEGNIDPLKSMSVVPAYFLYSSDISKRSINVPEGITTIKKYAFSYCKSIDSIKLPKSLEVINERAFKYSDIKSIEFSSGPLLRNIESDAFCFCDKLSTLEISSNSSRLIVQNFAIDGCQSLTKLVFKGSAELWLYYNSIINCFNLQTIYLPKKVNIAWNAIDKCTSLKTIYFDGNKDEFKIVDSSMKRKARANLIAQHWTGRTIICLDGEIEY